MASPLSILKNVLNLNHNCMHVENSETIHSAVHHFGEVFEQMEIHVHARPYKRVQRKCPVCGRKCPGYDHKQEHKSRWRAPNLNGVPVYICYRPQRIRCPEHGVLTEYIPWADGSSRFTREFNDEIAWMACRMSKTDIALYENINWRTVGSCVKAAQTRLEPDVTARMHGLKKICVDETSYSKGQSYITVVYDMERNRVVWIHEGNGLEIFKLFCNALPEKERLKVEVIAGDGARWIDTCAKQYFPNATRCVDFFHVVEWINEKLDNVRTLTASKARREYERRKKEFQLTEAAERDSRAAQKKEIESRISTAMEELGTFPKRGRPCKRKKELILQIDGLKALIPSEPEEKGKAGRPRKEKFTAEHQKELDRMAEAAKSIKGSKYALAHNPENCTERQEERIKLIENSYPDLYRAYQLKESLRLILHMKDAAIAEEELDKWISEAASSDIIPMAELSEKITRHRDNIMNSIRCQANSAKSEAVNTTIKVLIKMARGFRNIDNMIALIYLKCSDLVIPLFNRHQMSAEKAAAARETANDLRRKRQSSPVPA